MERQLPLCRSCASLDQLREPSHGEAAARGQNSIEPERHGGGNVLKTKRPALGSVVRAPLETRKRAEDTNPIFRHAEIRPCEFLLCGNGAGAISKGGIKDGQEVLRERERRKGG